ncbi:MAG: insecticidal toxin protein [Candidatus Desulforudis sp.]|nr:insecticidal toxin protein [Desulforudis sp.]
MNYLMETKHFHGLLDNEVVAFKPGLVVETTLTKYLIIQEREVSYHFYLHQHPYVQQLVQRLLRKGTAELQAADTEYVRKPDGSFETLPGGKFKPVLYSDFFDAAYKPNTALVEKSYPVKDLDFTTGGAYSAYNWELFYHVPLTMAIHLSKNQRFAEAQRWFHFLFDPTDDSDGPTPERFWKVRPFQYTDVKKIEEILVNLATGADETLRNETIHSIEAWKDAPFRPHVIARYRQQAYMYKTVMAYLDNLIAWGDSLFRQDTGEAIDEALQLYVLAANILGPRPQPVPKKGGVRPQTYANLRQDLSRFGTVMRDMEADLPFDLMPFPTDDGGDNDRLATLRSLGKALYFCVPRNDKLLSYWDTVADRLFKIRNSLNIQGVFRQLALFEPPIDPAMLARAAAAGLDVGAIINGLNQPLPLVRFQLLVQKAAEIVQEVKSLGNNLLSAMEREDGEALAILRARHERVVMEMVEHVRYGQLQEAIKSKEGLLHTLALAVQRYTFYERQLGGKTEEIEKTAKDAIQALGELDKDSFDKMKFSMEEPEVSLRDIEVDIAQDLNESGGKIISSHERQELLRLKTAQRLQEEGANLNIIAKFLSLIPELGAQAQPMGVGAAIQFGGRALSTQLSLAADASSITAGRNIFEANKSSKIGSYARREQDWAFQSNLAAGEITQILKQLRAAQIREAIAELELKNHRQQMKHAEEIERFLNEEGTEKTGKKTNKSLYAWMKREVKGLYSQCFQCAFDIAKKAERALQHELGDPELSYLRFGYLAGKEGLLAGEKLYLDVKRMEMAYHDLNQREYELTKHVSLLQVDPLALIQLRTTGRCTVRLPEALFDMDGPGHYFRRIKTVAVSIPCVTGPYAGVNCTLTLLKSSIRRTQVLRDGVYAREDAQDDRFSDYFGSLQSIVTSSAQNDSGLFETNLRDERYLPFENSGVISEWQLQLPADPSKGEPAQFDYDSISDVILHICYTAREGGGLLRNGAVAHVKKLITEAQAAGSVRLFSVRHEFPTEWAKFQSQASVPGQRFELTLNLQEEHYPFWSRGRLNSVTRVDILARSTVAPVPGSMDVADKADKNDGTAEKDSLVKDAALGDLLVGKLANVGLPAKPVGELKLFLDAKAISDLWIAVTWSE